MPLKFSNYSLIRSPRGTVFLLVDNARRGFASRDVFKIFGYNPVEVIAAGWDDINSYQEGAPLTATSTYPTGALLQDKATGGVFWVYEGKKAPLLEKSLLTYKFENKKIIQVTQAELKQYPITDPVLFGNGELLTTVSPYAIYLIDEGKKRPFISLDIFTKLGYKISNVITVSPQFMTNYENGEPIEGNNF